MSGEKKETPKKQTREHGKKYAPYIENIIIDHLSGMTDKEMANVLERKVPLLRNKRTEVMRDFTLKQVQNVNFLLWEVTRLVLEKELLIERLDSVGITVAGVEIPDEAIVEKLIEDLEIPEEQLKEFKDQRFKDYLDKKNKISD